MTQSILFYCQNLFIHAIKRFRVPIAIVLISWWLYIFYHRHVSPFAIHNDYKDYWSGLPNILSTVKSKSPFKMSLRQPLSFHSDIIHWIHVSDIHINSYDSVTRERFIKFLDDVIPLTSPSFVLATGDLTDGKDSLGLTTKQIESDWKFYSSQLLERGYYRKDFWYDIPGNHDRFNVLGKKSPGYHKTMLNNETLSRASFDYFKIYSVQKEYTYHQLIRLQGKSHKFLKNNVTLSEQPVISIIGLDSCPYPGPPRPSNFFGYVVSEQMDMLEMFLKEDHKLDIPPLRRIILNHYPITTNMFSRTKLTKKTFAELSESFGLYLCGHLHDLGGIAPELYAVHPTGFAELEVSDMKSNGVYRLMTFCSDGRYAFSEHSVINRFPIVHMITPKDSRFILPQREEIEFGPWIEFLLFSFESILDISCTINHVHVPISIQDCTNQMKSSPLIYIPFNWTILNIESTHYFSIQVTDGNGNIYNQSFSFTLDGRPLPIHNFGHFLLHIRWRFFFQYLLILAYMLILVIVIILPRIITIKSSVVWSCFRTLSYWKPFYIPWFIYLAYVPLFPLFVGSFVPASSSIFSVYTFGAYDHSAESSEYPWLPLVDTWDILLFFTYSFTIPCLILLLVRIFVTSQHLSRISRTSNILSTTRRAFRSMVIIWWFFAGCIVLLICSSYGLMSSLVSPGITWFYAWNTWLYFYSNPPNMIQ